MTRHRNQQQGDLALAEVCAYTEDLLVAIATFSNSGFLNLSQY